MTPTDGIVPLGGWLPSLLLLPPTVGTMPLGGWFPSLLPPTVGAVPLGGWFPPLFSLPPIGRIVSLAFPKVPSPLRYSWLPFSCGVAFPLDSPSRVGSSVPQSVSIMG